MYVDPVVIRALVVALIAAIALIAALVAGMLAHNDGASRAGAALTGGAAFASALVLGLTIATALRVV